MQHMHIFPEPSQVIDHSKPTSPSVRYSDIIVWVMQAAGIPIDRNKKGLPVSFASDEAKELKNEQLSGSCPDRQL